MSSDIKFDFYLDVKGMSCPLPLLKMAKTMKILMQNQVLKMEATDKESATDIPAWVEKTGHKILKTEFNSGSYVYYIQKM